MGKINGTYAREFIDRDIKVSVFLNRDKDVASYNSGKRDPVLLTKTHRADGAYIGNVVVCQEGSVVAISVASDKSTCGLEPRIKTQQETLTEGIYWISKQRNAPNFNAWVKRYSSKKEAFKVSNFKLYADGEGFKRANMTISGMDIASATYDGVNLPKAGLEADGVPGAVDGVPTTAEFEHKLKNVVSGNELGALECMFFVLADANAVDNFYTAVRGVTDKGW